MEEQATLPGELDQRLGARIREERARLGLSLQALSLRCGVSRAMISKIERGESSPTAALLGRLCAGLGMTLANLFADETRRGEPLSRRADQPVWRDPETGYIRRDVAPSGTGSPLDIVEVTFPPGARVAYDRPWTVRAAQQHVWVLDGVLEMTIGDEVHRLENGDCLFMRLDRPLAFHNPGARPVRYAVMLMLEGSRA